MPSFNGRSGEKNEKGDEYSSNIRVGHEYQATIPDMLVSDNNWGFKHPERLVWSPDNNLSDSQRKFFIEFYCFNAHILTFISFVIYSKQLYSIC